MVAKRQQKNLRSNNFQAEQHPVCLSTRKHVDFSRRTINSQSKEAPPDLRLRLRSLNSLSIVHDQTIAVRTKKLGFKTRARTVRILRTIRNVPRIFGPPRRVVLKILRQRLQRLDYLSLDRILRSFASACDAQLARWHRVIAKSLPLFSLFRLETLFSS